MGKTVDLWVVYRIIDRLVTPFDETEAFELGIIDKDGKLQRKPKTREEKNAYNPFDRFIFNLKRILWKAGLKSKFSSYAAALFLIKESENLEYWTDRGEYAMQERLFEEMKTLKTFKDPTFQKLINEEAPTNATGSAVVGTGSDPLHWVKQQRRKRHGKPINGLAFLRRRKYEERKKRKKEEEINNA